MLNRYRHEAFNLNLDKHVTKCLEIWIDSIVNRTKE